MGTNGTLYTGGLAPTPQVYDIDGIERTPPRPWPHCTPSAST